MTIRNKSLFDFSFSNEVSCLFFFPRTASLCYSCTHQHILPVLQHWAVPFFSLMVSLCRGYLEVDFSLQILWSDAQYVRLSVSLPAAGASASYIALLNCRSVTELRLHHCPHVLMWHSQSYQRCPPPLLLPHIHTQPVPPRVLPTLGWSWHVCVTEQRWRWALRSYSAPNADAECSENCLNQSHAFL